jgi:hypothetical protein
MTLIHENVLEAVRAAGYKLLVKTSCSSAITLTSGVSEVVGITFVTNN